MSGRKTAGRPAVARRRRQREQRVVRFGDLIADARPAEDDAAPADQSAAEAPSDPRRVAHEAESGETMH